MIFRLAIRNWKGVLMGYCAFTRE